MVLRKLAAAGAGLLLPILMAVPAAADAGVGYVVVQPSAMHGWAFNNDNGNLGSGQMVFGPGQPPYGAGSAELTLTSAVDGWALVTGNHEGTKLSDIRSLDYWTFTQNLHAIALQLAVDLGDGHYHRLVFEPGYNGNPLIVPGNWQQWNPTNAGAGWWITHATTVCTQTIPCTWTQVLALYGSAPIKGGIWLKAGSGWPAGAYNVDGLHFSATVPASNVIYDFEPTCQESQGNGDFTGNNGNGNFQFDGDNACETGGGDSIDSGNRGDGKDFHSTSVQSSQRDQGAHTMTMTGLGISGGMPVAFTLVALETGNGLPGWVSLTLSDGFANAGNLTSGSISLH
jgi:hypothetical protein